MGTATGSATSAARRGSSSSWPRRSADDPEACALRQRLVAGSVGDDRHQAIAAGAQLVAAQPPGEFEAVGPRLACVRERPAQDHVAGAPAACAVALRRLHAAAPDAPAGGGLLDLEPSRP